MKSQLDLTSFGVEVPSGIKARLRNPQIFALALAISTQK